jgi:hypothetical protein
VASKNKISHSYDNYLSFYLIFLYMSWFLKLVLDYYYNSQCIRYEWILNFPHPLIYYLIFMSPFLRLVLDNYLNNYTHTCTYWKTINYAVGCPSMRRSKIKKPKENCFPSVFMEGYFLGGHLSFMLVFLYHYSVI